jgi:hypothetical protein
MGELRDAYKILVGKPEKKRPRGRPIFKRENNIIMDFQEEGWEDVDWIHLAQDSDQWWAVMNTVIKIRAHLNVFIG